MKTSHLPADLHEHPRATPLPSVLVAHSGKQHAYRHAAAVAGCGCLARFVTSGYYRPAQIPDRWISHIGWLDRRLRRRHFADLEDRRVSRKWGLELPELVVRSLCGNGTRSDHWVYRRDARFDRWVARRFASQAEVLWGFQGSCLESLRAARAARRIAVAEYSTAHVTWAIELLSREAQRHPEWADSISNYRFPAWYQHRLEQEPHEADYCIAASEFTRQSLLAAGVSGSRIELLPLGADLEQFSYSPRRETGPFRVLFVGGVGQRKGIKYLLEAATRLRSSELELVLVGPLVGSGRGLEAYRGRYTHLGRLDSTQVVAEMRKAQVLVLPSVFEGFGLVIPEALATGMPVIASTHSIGPQIIRDGVDGFVLPPDDVEGLAERLDWLATHRAAAAEMGRAGARRAQEFSWNAHAERVRSILEKLRSEIASNLP